MGLQSNSTVGTGGGGLCGAGTGSSGCSSGTPVSDATCVVRFVQDEGIELPCEPTINFSGAGVTAEDDPDNCRINVTIPGGGGEGGGHIIQDEGVDLPAETRLNFIGDTVTAADDPGNGRTNVTIVREVYVNGSLVAL